MTSLGRRHARDRGPAARDAHAQPHRHHRGRGGHEDPREVPACAGERGVGPAARAHLRQDLPAHVRGLPRARRAQARRGVPPALRAAQPAGARRRCGPNLSGRRGAPAPRLDRAVAGARSWASCCSSASLYLLGTWGDDDEEPAPTAERAATPTATADADAAGRERAPPAAPTRVRLRIVASGPVSVCLEAADGTPLIDNVTLDAGDRSQRFRGKRFLASFGTGAAVMRVNGEDVRGLRRRPDRLRAPARPPPAAACPRTRRPTCEG